MTLREFYDSLKPRATPLTQEEFIAYLTVQCAIARLGEIVGGIVAEDPVLSMVMDVWNDDSGSVERLLDAVEDQYKNRDMPTLSLVPKDHG